jgi:hypothetical protein
VRISPPSRPCFWIATARRSPRCLAGHANAGSNREAGTEKPGPALRSPSLGVAGGMGSSHQGLARVRARSAPGGPAPARLARGRGCAGGSGGSGWPTPSTSRSRPPRKRPSSGRDPIGSLAVDTPRSLDLGRRRVRTVGAHHERQTGGFRRQGEGATSTSTRRPATLSMETSTRLSATSTCASRRKEKVMGWPRSERIQP